MSIGDSILGAALLHKLGYVAPDPATQQLNMLILMDQQKAIANNATALSGHVTNCNACSTAYASDPKNALELLCPIGKQAHQVDSRLINNSL